MHTNDSAYTQNRAFCKHFFTTTNTILGKNHKLFPAFKNIPFSQFRNSARVFDKNREIPYFGAAAN